MSILDTAMAKNRKKGRGLIKEPHVDQKDKNGSDDKHASGGNEENGSTEKEDQVRAQRSFF